MVLGDPAEEVEELGFSVGLLVVEVAEELVVDLPFSPPPEVLGAEDPVEGR